MALTVYPETIIAVGLSFREKNVPSTCRLKDSMHQELFYISFLNLPRHRIYAPQQVQLLKDGVAYKTIDLKPEDSPEKGEMMKATVPADLNGTEQLSIKISCLKKPGTQMGIDEIAFIP